MKKFRRKKENKTEIKSISQGIQVILALIIYVGFFVFVVKKTVGNKLNFDIYIKYSQVIAKGWVTTIVVSLAALILSLLFGMIIYAMEKSKITVLEYLAKFHKSLIFGVPLLVIIIASYYYIGDAFKIKSKFFIGIVTLGLYIGAYIADIYRGAVESVHDRQWQAAKMFGFTKYQTYRHIIFPQVLMTILPPLTGQLALLIKGSALLSYMAFDEFFNVISTVQASTYAYAEGFVIAGIGYLIMTVPLLCLIRVLEKKINYRGM